MSQSQPMDSPTSRSPRGSAIDPRSSAQRQLENHLNLVPPPPHPPDQGSLNPRQAAAHAFFESLEQLNQTFEAAEGLDPNAWDAEDLDPNTWAIDDWAI